MNLRHSTARAIRKLADFIDPRTEPSSRTTLVVEVDSTDATRKLNELTQKAEDLRNALALLSIR